jgi:hypothetical protein
MVTINVDQLSSPVKTNWIKASKLRARGVHDKENLQWWSFYRFRFSVTKSTNLQDFVRDLLP